MTLQPEYEEEAGEYGIKRIVSRDSHGVTARLLL